VDGDEISVVSDVREVSEENISNSEDAPGQALSSDNAATDDK
jgi:hypothetical protein